MSETKNPDWLPTSQLRWMRCTLLDLSAKLDRYMQDQAHLTGRQDSLERLIHHWLAAAHPIRPGPPSSATSPPQTQPPTPGTPWSTWIDLMKRARALGEWVGLIGKIVGLIKGGIAIFGIIIPAMVLAASTLWKLAAPYLQRWLAGF